MQKRPEVHLDFEIDKLTNSIENAISGEVFDTIVTRMDLSYLKQIKKADWLFDWQGELKDKDRMVYNLTTVNNAGIIHGLISITDKGDHIFMNLIESAKFNKGSNRLYKGVGGNLVAFACKTAFELKYEGVVSFIAKTQLIEYYEQVLGAKVFAGNRMYISTKNSVTLVRRYFKDFSYDEL
jgi:hypothetical protein